MAKADLSKEVTTLFKDEDVQNYNEYNWFCTEMIEELVPYLNEKGLLHLKKGLERIRDQHIRLSK